MLIYWDLNNYAAQDDTQLVYRSAAYFDTGHYQSVGSFAWQIKTKSWTKHVSKLFLINSLFQISCEAAASCQRAERGLVPYLSQKISALLVGTFAHPDQGSRQDSALQSIRGKGHKLTILTGKWGHLALLCKSLN